MKFEIGDSVLVLDEDLSGIIKAIDGKEISIETDDGFLLNFDATELILKVSSSYNIASKINNTNIQDVIAEKEQAKRKSSKKMKPKAQAQAAVEIDLHINHLVKSSRGMTNFDMLNKQIQTAKYQLEFAIKKRIPRIVFIHGVGEGVLKQELETLFRRYDNITYYDANYQKYGLGATEVYIYQNTN